MEFNVPFRHKCGYIRDKSLTVASLDEDSKQQQSVENGPEDLTAVGLDEAGQPLDIELHALRLLLLQRRYVVERRERRVSVLRISARLPATYTFTGSRPSDHYVRSVCWFVCLFVIIIIFICSNMQVPFPQYQLTMSRTERLSSSTNNCPKPKICWFDKTYIQYIILKTRMWANAQPDGRPAEHR